MTTETIQAETGHDGQIDCSVVIVNYHSEEELVGCLESLRIQAGQETLEIIVVDNSATLAGAGILRRFPEVRLIENPKNLGFAGASNQGLRLARGRRLLLLNPDAEMQEGALQALVRYMDEHPRVGAAGPRLLDPDGSLQYSCRRFPGYLTVFFGRYSWLTRFLPANPVSRRYLYLDWNHECTAEVDWLSGACLMVRREVLETVGPLDEGYFLFVEDMDWCRRIRDAGWSVDYVAPAVVKHRIGASRGPVSAGVIWARHRSMLRYFRKHFRSPWPLAGLVAAGLGLRTGVELALNALRRRRLEPEDQRWPRPSLSSSRLL